VAGSYVHGVNTDTQEPLGTVPPYFITTTLGNRLSDRVTAAVRWQYVGAKKNSEVPDLATGSNLFIPTSSYNLVNLYIGYKINDNTTATFAVENLLDERYSPYMSVWANDFTGGAPVVEPFYSPGITLKASLKAHFGGG
jgi:hemoglobin/transferrin/lactoferrin receptor protein